MQENPSQMFLAPWILAASRWSQVDSQVQSPQLHITALCDTSQLEVIYITDLFLLCVDAILVVQVNSSTQWVRIVIHQNKEQYSFTCDMSNELNAMVQLWQIINPTFKAGKMLTNMYHV